MDVLYQKCSHLLFLREWKSCMYLWLQLVNHKMIIYDDIQNVTKFLVLQKI